MRLIDADALQREYMQFQDGKRSVLVDVAPTIEPERKKGKWLPDNINPYEIRFVCSECKESQAVPTIGFTAYKPIWNWCPLCGADMRGGDAE